MRAAKLARVPTKTSADLAATSLLSSQQPRHALPAHQDFMSCAQLVTHALTTASLAHSTPHQATLHAPHVKLQLDQLLQTVQSIIISTQHWTLSTLPIAQDGLPVSPHRFLTSSQFVGLTRLLEVFLMAVADQHCLKRLPICQSTLQYGWNFHCFWSIKRQGLHLQHTLKQMVFVY